MKGEGEGRTFHSIPSRGMVVWGIPSLRGSCTRPVTSQTLKRLKCTPVSNPAQVDLVMRGDQYIGQAAVP